VHYSDEARTARCCRSLRASTGARPCVIVVDNSVDGSFNDPKAEVVPGGPRLGYGGAVNLAARRLPLSQSLFVVSNPDVIYASDALAALLDAAKRHPKAACLGPALFTDEALSSPADVYGFDWDRYLFIRHSPPITSEPHSVDYVDGAAMLIRRRCFDEVDGFDERYFLYAEDSDLCLRLRRSGYPCLRIPASRVYHEGHSSVGSQSSLAAYYGVRGSLCFAAKFAARGAQLRLGLFVTAEALRRAWPDVARCGATAAGLVDFARGRFGAGPRWLATDRRKRRG